MLRGELCVSVSDVARPPIASIVNAFFGFIYRSLQLSASRRTDRLNHLTRSEHARSFSVTSVVLCVCLLCQFN